MTFLVGFEKSDGPKTLDKGNYIGIVTGIDKKLDKDKKWITFKVNIDGEIYQSRRYYISSNNFYLKQAFEQLGIKVPDGQVDLDTLELAGTKAEFTVKEREYNGKTYKDLEPVKAIGKISDSELLSLQGTSF
jgi:hypothetical protein